MKSDSIFIQQLIEKSTKLQHQVDSMQMQQKLNELTYKFENSNKIAAEAQAFYQVSWNNLLWLIIFLVTLVGIAVPYISTVVQRRNIKDAENKFKKNIENMEHKINDTESNFKKNIKEMESKINDAEKRNIDLDNKITVTESYALFSGFYMQGKLNNTPESIINLSSAISLLPSAIKHTDIDEEMIDDVLGMLYMRLLQKLHQVNEQYYIKLIEKGLEGYIDLPEKFKTNENKKTYEAIVKEISKS